MDAKKFAGISLLLLGIIGLIVGIFGIFQGFQLGSLSPWPMAILGFVFFSSGVGLLRSVRSAGGEAS